MPSISVRRLYQDNQHKLQLAWAAGTAGADNRIGVEADKPVLALVGHLNFIHPNQVQVIGVAEAEYLRRMESDDVPYDLDAVVDSTKPLRDIQAGSSTPLGRFGKLFDIPMSMVIVANGLPVSPMLRDYCHTNNIPLLTSKLESPHLMDVLRIYLQRQLAVSTVKHGVFLDVFEIGVMITGQSGLGKSELALELISRGHSLIADDAVEFYRTGPETIDGRCPPMLRDFLEVRGLGILNIRHIFGETSIRPRKMLQLIINLVPADDEYMKRLDRLSIRSETESVLDVSIRSVTLPVAVGRNLAVLVEAAVRNYILQLRGKDSTKEFLERHQTILKENEPKHENSAD
ncbi:HPr(Ser) kinase/phosphatase [Neisseria sp.]|uniref:HPr(Ser) kinase/phosphatase n=1 Tax=Neisseria sp. TaxID=192066 RepID=UPI00359F36A5